MPTISSNNVTTLYTGNVQTGNTGSTNLTTLYSGAGVNINPTAAYGNANVTRFLNAGTDGANTIENIVANANITANYYFGNGAYLTGITATNANYANYAGNLVVVGNESNVYVRTANTNIESRTQSGNAFTVQYQSSNSWEVYPEDDTTGANFAWAWIRAELPTVDTPTVFIENKKGIDGIEYRWTFDENGNTYFPTDGNIFLGNVNEVHINDGSPGYVLSTDGAGNLSWVAQSGGSGSNISNGTSNVDIATANGNVTFGVNGTANVLVVGNTSANFIGNVVASKVLSPNIWDVEYIRANTTFGNLFLQPYAGGNVYINGQFGGANLNIQGNITSENANLGNLAVANFFSGDGGLLSNINGSNVSNVANANYANFAGTLINGNSNITIAANSNIALSVAGTANVLVISNNSANLTGNLYTSNANLGNLAVANFFSGDGGLLSNINGSNVSNVANANYANFAGTLINGNSNIKINANANIFFNVNGISNVLQLGNSVANFSGNVIISNTANVRSTTFNFIPNGTAFGGGATNVASFLVQDYGSQSSNAQPYNITFAKSRGNSTNPAASSNSDQIARINFTAYNGNAYPRTGIISVVAQQAANANFTSSGTQWTPGAINITTGNPFGNTLSNTSSTPQNLMQWNEYGALILTPGTNGNSSGLSSGSLLFRNFGANADGSGQGAVFAFQRSRGNRDSFQPVQNGDQLGLLNFQGANGAASTYKNGAFISANVNTAYGTIGTGLIPTDLTISTSSNSTQYNTYFYGNGNWSFPSNVGIQGNVINQLKVYGNGSLGGAIVVTVEDEVNCPDIIFSNYSNNAIFNNYVVTRARGNIANPLPVQPNDAIYQQSYYVYSNVGYPIATAGSFRILVKTNDLAGNITTDLRYEGPNSGVGDDFTVVYSNATFTGNVTAQGNITSLNANLGNLATANYFQGDGSLLTNVSASTTSFNVFLLAGM